MSTKTFYRKQHLLIISITILFCSFLSDASACTSAIFTGKATKDGRPLMWKNRDTDQLNNRLEYFSGPLYGFVALVNSPSKGGEAWAGNNEVGFCIMNTASYNIDLKEDSKHPKDGEGVLMYRALGVCKTLKDFEYFLDTMTKPAPIEANFGVIDAFGGAAYYEVNSRTWVKRDANDPALAPNGYLIVTNFSFTGREDEGLGYIRHTTAEHLINKAYSEVVKFTPQWIMNNLSRSFYHSLLGLDVVESGLVKQTNGWFIDQDFISRKSTSAISIFQGVKKGEDAGNTIYWCALGYGPLAVCMPVITKFLPEIPKDMLSLSQSGKMNEINEFYPDVKPNYSVLPRSKPHHHNDILKRVFPIKRGSGGRYVNVGKLFNEKGTGYTQQIIGFEDDYLKKCDAVIEKVRKGTATEQDIENIYNGDYILNLYCKLLAED